jgi:hypothetical protein
MIIALTDHHSAISLHSQRPSRQPLIIMSNNNEFLFRARRLKEQNKTLLEAYGERDIVTFFRYNMPKMQDNNSSLVEANYDFGPVIEHAALLNEKIVCTILFHLHCSLPPTTF